MKLRYLTDLHAVASQIQAGHVPALKDEGFSTIINNRPDGEMWGQPKSADIEAAAKEAGMEYYHVPVGRQGLSPEMIETIKQAHDKATGKVLAFCNSGTRSANLWGLSQAGKMGVDEIINAGMKAGYNLHGLRPWLERATK